MMMARSKQLNEAKPVTQDQLSDAEISALLMRANRQATASRKTQAMLAGSGDEPSGRRWYVLRTVPRFDKAVEKTLVDAKVEHWMPTEKRPWKRPNSRKIWIQERPVMPGYVFVRVLSCASIWGGLARVRGALSVISGAHGPLPVSDENVLKLKAVLESDEEDIEAVKGLYRSGDKVHIDHGPFASFPAVVERVVGIDMARILVTIFGREVRTTIPLADLSK
ncbi:transcription termination/antitermination protein NusG [Nitratireductor aquibiodomus]|uniref:transcription termination/antitermination protein NusG n=1 Tax=Nitratireductor aquibiodomus TaxID=204799 RepID=UPI00046863D7|nr:transcription termination/antitermination protein NusG [Nitratireductor aquibiodomus]